MHNRLGALPIGGCLHRRAAFIFYRLAAFLLRVEVVYAQDKLSKDLASAQGALNAGV